jgi:ATP-dependent helicase HrpB
MTTRQRSRRWKKSRPVRYHSCMSLPRLPIDDVLPELRDALRHAPNVVLQAPTGAGKTTRVPPALLDAGLAEGGDIILVEPRRLAARAAAARMAFERGQNVGDDAGYHVRFDRRIGPKTRIVAVTDGILLRRLLDDPYLEGTALVLFDEFHERSLSADLALGITRLVQQTVRPELRIVVMSATLDAAAAATYLGSCPIVRSEGRLFPVEIRYQPRSLREPPSLAAAQATMQLAGETPGDLLVFLPGWNEIRHAAKHLESFASERNIRVLPLHGDLSAEEQDAALAQGERRKIVLATNVAETSVTVDGVTGVVDTGLARQLHFDPRLGLDRLQLTPIAQMSADQRAGRAGRQQPGICIRLWSEASQRQRPAATEPEVRRVDLAAAVLQLLCLGEHDLQRFPWFEMPRPEAVRQALDLLKQLGAVRDGRVTELGVISARLPAHPRLGRMLVESWRLGQPERTALAAALLSERDPFPLTPGEALPAGTARTADFAMRLEMLEAFARKQPAPAQLHRPTARTILRVQQQLLRELRLVARGFKALQAQSANRAVSADEALGRTLLAGFPDRVARRRASDPRRGVMAGGRGVRLAPASSAIDAELFLCLDVEDRPKEALVRLALPVQRDWLPSEHLSDAIEVFFDEAAERVTARRRLRYLDLLVEESHAAITDVGQASAALLEAAQCHVARVLPPADSAAGAYLMRLRCLGEWMPDLNLPAFDDDFLRTLLPGLCAGRRSFAELRDGPWLEAVQQALTPQQCQVVEREAPARLEVPSGSRIALAYEVGRPPVLAVQIQEVFGLRDTPRIAGGRVRVLLHLLGPNYRPQQVTDDLASFWANVYPRIRKELRARYPKHAWPEDPLNAPAQRGPKRR